MNLLFNQCTKYVWFLEYQKIDSISPIVFQFSLWKFLVANIIPKSSFLNVPMLGVIIQH